MAYTHSSPLPSESSIPVSELDTVALLLSESKFTTATLTRALGSSVPFLHIHLPLRQFLQIHSLKPRLAKSALLSGIPLSVVRKSSSRGTRCSKSDPGGGGEYVNALQDI
ncbi:hypothetical protein BDR03DRAFT_966090, partial [Suillus americanus]